MLDTALSFELARHDKKYAGLLATLDDVESRYRAAQRRASGETVKAAQAQDRQAMAAAIEDGQPVPDTVHADQARKDQAKAKVEADVLRRKVETAKAKASEHLRKHVSKLEPKLLEEAQALHQDAYQAIVAAQQLAAELTHKGALLREAAKRSGNRRPKVPALSYKDRSFPAHPDQQAATHASEVLDKLLRNLAQAAPKALPLDTHERLDQVEELAGR